MHATPSSVGVPETLDGKLSGVLTIVELFTVQSVHLPEAESDCQRQPSRRLEWAWVWAVLPRTLQAFAVYASAKAEYCRPRCRPGAFADLVVVFSL